MSELDNVRRQRNEALDRVASLEVDLAAALARASTYGDKVVELSERLSQHGNKIIPLKEAVRLAVESVNRKKLTKKQRADLDAANSSVQ